ncbi:MAG: EamA family transporter [Lachnospiraceae bacterium]|nr:EamA family transporter [Lachnospiraceae bacterium]
MFHYVWPILLVVLSNTVYQVCTKGVPENMNPFASLIITYLVGAAVSLIMFFVLGDSGDILAELKKTNWTSFALGFVIVGLEVGFIYAYKAGWKVSAAQIVASSILGVILIIVGYVGYKEAITWNKIVGVIVCLVGLGLINMW